MGDLISLKSSMGNVDISGFIPSSASSSGTIKDINTNVKGPSTYKSAYAAVSNVENMDFVDISDVKNSMTYGDNNWFGYDGREDPITFIDTFVASGVNLIFSAVSAVLNLVESVGDVGFILLGVIESGILGVFDIIALGDYTFYETKKSFADTMAFVSIDYSNIWLEEIINVVENIFGLEDQWFEKNADKYFKSDKGLFYDTIGKVVELYSIVGIGSMIAKGVSIGSDLVTSIVYGVNTTGSEFETSTQKFNDINQIQRMNFLDVMFELGSDIMIGVVETFGFALTYGSNLWKNILPGIEKTTGSKMIVQGIKSSVKDIIKFGTGDLFDDDSENDLIKVGCEIIYNAVVAAFVQGIYDVSKGFTSSIFKSINNYFSPKNAEPSVDEAVQDLKGNKLFEITQKFKDNTLSVENEFKINYKNLKAKTLSTVGKVLPKKIFDKIKKDTGAELINTVKYLSTY